MKRIIVLTAVIVVAGAVESDAADWPAFRGPNGDGTSFEKDVPLIGAPNRISNGKSLCRTKAIAARLSPREGSFSLARPKEDSSAGCIATID